MTSFSNASLNESHSTCVIPVQSAQIVGKAVLIHLFVAILWNSLYVSGAKVRGYWLALLYHLGLFLKKIADIVRTQSSQGSERT